MAKVLRRYMVRYTNYMGTKNKICYVYAYSKKAAYSKSNEAIRDQEHGYYPRERVVEAVLMKNGRIHYFNKEV